MEENGYNSHDDISIKPHSDMHVPRDVKADEKTHLTWLFRIKLFVCISHALLLCYPGMAREDQVLPPDSTV